MFYKYTDEQLISGLHVMYPDGTLLHKDVTDLTTLPFDGWYYFETEEEAKSFFGIND